MDENPTDVPTEITPEDFDGETATDKVDSSPAEDKKPEVAEEAPKEEVKPDDTGTPPEEDKPKETDTDSEEETPTEAPDTNKPTTKADERKAQLNTEIRDLVAQRNALKTEVEKATSEVYQPATEKDLVGEINDETGERYTTLEAKVEAMRQENEMLKFNERVADAQLTLGAESMQVMKDYPIFDQSSDQYEAELAQDAAELFEGYLIRDENVPEIDPQTGKPTGRGLIIGSRASPAKFYSTIARAHGLSTAKGQIRGQEATEEMLANADTTATVAPAKKPKDPLAEIWEEEL